MKNKIFILAFALMVIFPMLQASAQAYNYENGIFDKYEFTVTSAGATNVSNAYDNNQGTYAAFTTTSGFIEFTFEETIDAIYAYYINSNNSVHIGTIFYDESNNVLLDIERMNPDYVVIEPIFNVKKIRVYNSSNLTDRRITELEYFDEPVAIYQNYDLDSIDSHANETLINTFINQYTYVYPVRGVFESNGSTFLNIVGSNDIMNPYYDASENRLYFDLNNNAYILGTSGSINPATSANLNSYLSLTTDAGEPNTANFYFTYPASPPAAPEGLTATPGDEQVTLNWDANNEDDLAGYYVYQDGIRITSSLITATSYTVTGLINGTSYEFFVTAVDTNDNESPPSGSVTAAPEENDTTAPAAPSGLTATPLPGRIFLKWNAGSEEDLAGYYVYQDDVRVNSEPTSKNEMTVTDVVYGEDYTFFVTAVDTNDNESPPSGSVTASPLEDKSITVPALGLSALAIIGSAVSFITNVLPDWVMFGLAIIMSFVLVNFLFWILGKIRGESRESVMKSTFDKITGRDEKRKKEYLRAYRRAGKEIREKDYNLWKSSRDEVWKGLRQDRQERSQRNDTRTVRMGRPGRQGRA